MKPIMKENPQGGARAISGARVLYSVATPTTRPIDRRVALKSGAWITLRRAVPADAVRLVAMHNRLSPMSRYHRYLRPYTPNLNEMEELCRLERGIGEAFVAESDDPEKSIVGLIYYIRDSYPEEHQAEFGVTVDDGFQGGGLGRAMLDHMCEHARFNGVQRMEANVLPQNKKMLHLLDTSGKSLHKSLSPEFITVTMEIGEDGDEAQLMCLLADAAASPLPTAHSALCG
ncbi:MAG: GNAT family N-acetyltransferase [Desulfatitalea sp.]|nr:GNAT family N-acetyltransferase [Desulfatitalea sp.]MBI5896341.1 GNAT family N-acetyltransferase [Desulfobacterales bacterium]